MSNPWAIAMMADDRTRELRRATRGRKPAPAHLGARSRRRAGAARRLLRAGIRRS